MANSLPTAHLIRVNAHPERQAEQFNLGRPSKVNGLAPLHAPSTTTCSHLSTLINAHSIHACAHADIHQLVHIIISNIVTHVHTCSHLYIYIIHRCICRKMAAVAQITLSTWSKLFSMHMTCVAITHVDFYMCTNDQWKFAIVWRMCVYTLNLVSLLCELSFEWGDICIWICSGTCQLFDCDLCVHISICILVLQAKHHGL